MTKLIFGAFYSFFFILSANSHASQSYLSFDDQEKKYLERFIHSFFLEDVFSYTLFGEKPMSFSGVCQNKLNELPETRNFLKFSSQLSICKAANIFKKYRKLINDRYVFVFNECKSGNFIFFIEKQSFIKIINDNIDIFLKELGEDFIPENFLAEIVKEKTSFLDIIHHHEGILGILLGYGRHNSMLFQKKADILGRCWAYGNDIQLNNIKQKKLRSSSSSVEALRYLNTQLRSFSKKGEFDSLFPVPPLGFSADLEHSETKKLKEKYNSARQFINTTYSQSNPTNLILHMLFRFKSSSNLF